MPTMLETTLAMLHAGQSAAPAGRLIGFSLREIEPGRALFTMNVDERHHNPMGTLHGGIYCDIADAAMGMAYAATLAEGESFTTIELKINFIRPVISGRIRAVGRVVEMKKTLFFSEADVLDEQGRLVARASSTCMPVPEGQGRE